MAGNLLITIINFYDHNVDLLQTYKVLSVTDSRKLDVTAVGHVLDDVDSNLLRFRLSVESVFPADVSDDSIRFGNLYIVAFKTKL